jgi:hypothetical protein
MIYVRQFDIFGILFWPAYYGAGYINEKSHIWRNPWKMGVGSSNYWSYWSNPFEIPAFAAGGG